MAETRHLAGRPCVLTTAEAAELRDVGSAAEAEGLARRLRARWVAEALEQFRVELGQVPAQNLLPGLLHARDRARELAAEYRDGRR